MKRKTHDEGWLVIVNKFGGPHVDRHKVVKLCLGFYWDLNDVIKTMHEFLVGSRMLDQVSKLEFWSSEYGKVGQVSK